MEYMSDKPKKLKKVTFWLDQESLLSLQVLRDKKSLSVSAILREALREYLTLSETREALKKIEKAAEDLKTEAKIFEEYRMPEIKAELKELTFQVKQLNSQINKLTETLEVVAFWGSLVCELIKTRIFNTTPLSNEEYERFKKFWHLAHERADARIESLMGKRVWKNKFSPEKDPLK